MRIPTPEKPENKTATGPRRYLVLPIDPQRATAFFSAWAKRTGALPYRILMDRAGRLAEVGLGMRGDLWGGDLEGPTGPSEVVI
jgi:hypothetical protein